VLVDLLGRQLGLLAILLISRDLFLDVSLAFVIMYDGARGRGEVDALEQGCWSGGGGIVIIPRLRRWVAADLGPR
jgi:hypothetical protein